MPTWNSISSENIIQGFTIDKPKWNSKNSSSNPQEADSLKRTLTLPSSSKEPLDEEKEKTENANIKNKMEDITIASASIERLIRKYCEQF